MNERAGHPSASAKPDSPMKKTPEKPAPARVARPVEWESPTCRAPCRKALPRSERDPRRACRGPKTVQRLLRIVGEHRLNVSSYRLLPHLVVLRSFPGWPLETSRTRPAAQPARAGGH